MVLAHLLIVELTKYEEGRRETLGKLREWEAGAMPLQAALLLASVPFMCRVCRTGLAPQGCGQERRV